jgi:DNA repair exonuclease SbcCD nuclease subunit
MSKALIIGDPHIGKGVSIGKPGIGTGLNSRILDQMKILDWLLDVADKYHVKRFIITGDVFEDAKPDYTLVVLLMGWLKHCELNNIAVDIIEGNHDMRRSGRTYISSLDIIASADFPHVSLHKTISTVYLENACFTMVPFRDRRSLECDTAKEALAKIASVLPYELAGIPSRCDKILVGHLALEGSLPIGDEFDDAINELLCPASMFAGYDYVWMGHVHRPHVLRKKPYIAHIGSLDLSDFGETDHTKIVVLYDSENPNKFTEIPVPSRPLRRVKFNIPAQINMSPTDFALDLIGQMNDNVGLKNAIVKIDIRIEDPDAPPLDKELIANYIMAQGAQHICNFSESRNVFVVAPDKRDLVDSSVDPKAAIRLYADQLGLEDADKAHFIKLANEVVDEHNSK